MDGILSQEEINALLSGMSAEETDSSPDASATVVNAPAVDDVEDLSDVEKDAIGEVANISMGTSATTLYSLVNKKVNITTPVVSLSNWADLSAERSEPSVLIQIRYTKGLDGSNILILKEDDVKVITELMMGGDGSNIDGELGEIHLSAISEAMNQMMGSSATSLSQMLNNMIDISPPYAERLDVNGALPGGDAGDFLKGTFVKIAFRMQIDELVDSTILQLYPVQFAKSIVDTFLGGGASPEPSAPAAAPEPAPYEPPKVETTVEPQPAPMPQMQQMPQMQMPQMQMPPYDPSMMQQMYQMPPMYQVPPVGMNYQPAQFEQFSNNVASMPSNENIGLIMDVPLEVTVELGRTRRNISEILDFAPGTIIELDRLAGEPIDVLVNGKFVAKGEVVVIEESFGIRVTEIIK